MEIIKKFTAVQISTKTIDGEVKVELEYGRIAGAYYDRTAPKTEFNSEQEATEWAYKEDSSGNWLEKDGERFLKWDIQAKFYKKFHFEN